MAANSRRADPVVEALDSVVEALRENARVNQAAVRQARDILQLRSRGHSWRQILAGGAQPLIVEMLTDNLERIQTAGSQLRRESAAALHAEGATMEEIGALFGVSRQRVSSLLSSGTAGTAGASGSARRGRGKAAAPRSRGQASTASRRGGSQSTRRASDQSRSKL
ncbi:MAG TPA: hypothetical protein VFH50_02955 [Acidimicrobiales bacterium]|nr:hypothetical protein [Acidimicrobiales bacterium]